MVRGSRIILGAGTVIHRDGRMLVVKRAEDPDRGLWAFPGGVVEFGESPAEAAVRETREEVGLAVRIEGVFDVATYLPGELAGDPLSHVVVIDYLAKPMGKRVRLNAESSDFRWVLPAELRELPTTRQMKACAMKFERLGIS